MHYANGRAAKAGDLVRGKGCNIKHEIVGLLIFAHPGSSSCNCRVATVTNTSQVLINAVPAPDPDPNGALFFRQFNPTSMGHVVATIEYGQLDAFVALDPKTGEVLPPETT